MKKLLLSVIPLILLLSGCAVLDRIIPQPGLVNGTYTFYPRIRVNQAGVEKNLYVDRIVVQGEFFTIFITGGPTGRTGDGDYGNFWHRHETILLQNLNNPGVPFNPIGQGEDDDAAGTGGFYLMFRNVTGTRFSLTSTRVTPPWVFDEIDLNRSLELSIRQPDSPAAGSPAGLKNGTYTMPSRIRVNQAGIPMNLYIDRVIVRGEYFTIFLTGGPTGRAGDGDYGNFWHRHETILLQNLDRSGRPFHPINQGEDEVTGGFYLMFQNVTGNRFSLTATRVTPPWVFDEFILGEPD